jgi:hypothetical protein
MSVGPGQTVHLHVGAPAGTRYRIEVYRLGWYGGVGARLLACAPLNCVSDEPAVAQPAAPAPDPTTGYLDAGWSVTDVVPVGSNWVSGEYVAKMLTTAGPGVGKMKMLPFVVRETTPTSPILVQIGVNTWQAYTNWGGKSLYGFNSTGGVAATEVSFNRSLNYVNWPFKWDYQLIRFLERTGYNLSYGTDIDTSQGLDALAQRRLVIVSGHDEYWDKATRDAFDAAQAAGTNMAFMGANNGYTQIRYGHGNGSIIEYRSTTLDPSSDPTTKTVDFRLLKPKRPECVLEGSQSGSLGAPPPSRDYSVASGALTNAWFNGTGFTQSSVLPGLVGYEWDTSGQPGCPQVQRLFTWSGLDGTNHASEADATTFTASSGARVFDAGTLQFSWGLDPYGNPGYADSRLQAFTKNMLDDLSGPPLAAPSNATLPSVSGSLIEGQTVTASPGTWNANPAPTFTYQWEDCDSSGMICSPVGGASSQRYTIQAGDVGAYLVVLVSASNSAGSSQASSTASTSVDSAPANSTRPSIQGSALQGQTLSATAGTWTGVPTPTLGYQWQDCDTNGANCTPIAGANATTYTIQASDIGDTIIVELTATNRAGFATADSPASTPVSAPTAAPSNATLPSVSGSLIEGQTVTASPGTWNANPAPTFTYQWQRCGSGSSTCTPIAGATASSHGLIAADVGSALTVTVTGTNGSGSAHATSATTTVVTSAPGPVTALLDDFNRANNSGPPSASWTHLPNGSASATSNLLISNQQATGVAGGSSGDYWNVSRFGPDSEAWITVSTKPNADLSVIGLFARLQNPSLATASGYQALYTFHSSGADQYKLLVRTNGSIAATLATQTGPALKPGDRLLLRSIGTTVELWRFSSGAWTRLLNATDTTYASAGYIALSAANNVVQVDDFGGGTLP